MIKDEKTRNLLKSGILLILIYWLFGHFDTVSELTGSFFRVISPFIAGGAIAFILSVPMNSIEKHLFKNKKTEKFNKLRRILSFFLTVVILISVITLAVFVVVPQLIQAVKTLSYKIPETTENIFSYLENIGIDYSYLATQLEELEIGWQDITDSIKKSFFEKSFGFVKSGIDVVSGIISGIATFFIGIVVSIYILFQKEKLSKQAKKTLIALLPKKVSDKIIELASLTHSIFAGFLSGQCLEALILGTLFCVTMLILRLPYAFLIGILISLCSFIPIVGAFIALIIGIFLIATVSTFKALIFAIMFFVLQQIEGQLIYPHVVGKSVGLPGLFVFTAVILGGRLFGALGIVLCIPLCSLFYCLFRNFINRRIKEKERTASPF